MKSLFRSLPIFFFLFHLGGCTSVEESSDVSASRTGTPEPRPVPAGVTRTGEVYLLRGLANVFSTGLDGMGAKMKARGMNVKVFNHTSWQAHANDIVARSKERSGISNPLMIMGHSFGADDGIRMANYLGSRGIRVDYLVTFDATTRGAVGPNIGRVRNFYVDGADGVSSYRFVTAAPGFQGDLKNTNLGKNPEHNSVHHLNIEKNAGLHDDIIQRAFSMTSRLPR
tara:strand:+ start:450 stop:1127 length:678 start_codon:yes stop_codon:yes gene_type:complete